MFDFIDSSLFIVYLYDICLIRPGKKLKYGIKLNELYKMRGLSKKMREFKEKKINKNQLHRGLVDQKAYNIALRHRGCEVLPVWKI